MVVTTYTCDRCKESVSGEDTLKLFRIFVGYGHYFDDARKRATGQVEGCEKCRIETGLQGPDKNQPEIIPQEPTLTLEDLIREIVREEVFNK